MSNGARHAIGLVIGLVAAPLIAAGLLYGLYQMGRSAGRVAATFGGDAGSERWIGAALLLGTAVLLALAVAPRVSPLASLIPGVLCTALGGVWIVDPGWVLRQDVLHDLLPEQLEMPYIGVAGPYGVFLLLGLLLLVASLMPGRWTGRAAAPQPMGPPPAPMPGGPAGPPPQAPGRPEPFSPSFSRPPAQSGPPQAPPAPPAAERPDAPSSGAVPFGRESDPQRGSGQGEGGEWTRMYGEDDLRRDGR
ncbi:hypothetical protein [Actinomadura algeriensis]|uniref:Uncharacterized protein n=1 Tax=Actinomadura algeriensis TaxID=1679523 RepID=A0ABR9JT65_9ACTN|nr:hypothetical protein [Actinomadura algeriensis]MBE1533762.1 hypothetical protein [Actinomadura algeriensis]